MQRFGVVVLFMMLCLGSMAAAGCAPRVLATVQANAEPMPVKLTWAAVPGPGLSASVPQTMLVVDEVAASLASALSLYNWKWLSNPDQAAQADVLVRIWWLAEGPQYVMERTIEPFYGPPYGSGVSVGFGTGGFWGRRRWRPFGYYGYGYGYSEPTIQAVYSRRLIVEALRADALPRATREALLPPPAAAKGQGLASAPNAPGAVPSAEPDAAGTASAQSRQGAVCAPARLGRRGPQQAALRRASDGQRKRSLQRDPLRAALAGLRRAGRTPGGRPLARGGDERGIERRYPRHPAAIGRRRSAGRGQEHAGRRHHRQRHARDLQPIGAAVSLLGVGSLLACRRPARLFRPVFSLHGEPCACSLPEGCAPQKSAVRSRALMGLREDNGLPPVASPSLFDRARGKRARFHPNPASTGLFLRFPGKGRALWSSEAFPERLSSGGLHVGHV